jgi:AcrR family transcriptional regulator
MASQRQPTAERRRQIAEAALRIIGREGVKRLTAAEIGREVGIADATVFRHYRNKQEIVLAAIELMHELLFDGSPPADPDPIDRLRTFFDCRLDMVRTRPEMVQFALNDRLLEAAGPDGVKRLFEIMQRSGAFVEGCLLEAQQRRLIAPTLALRSLTLVFLGTLHSTAFAVCKPACVTMMPVDPACVWSTLEALLRGSGGESVEAGSHQAEA